MRFGDHAGQATGALALQNLENEVAAAPLQVTSRHILTSFLAQSGIPI
jgi:hypothetical protein